MWHMKDNRHIFLFLENALSDKCRGLALDEVKLKFGFFHGNWVLETPHSPIPNLHNYAQNIRPGKKRNNQKEMKSFGTMPSGSELL